MTIRDVTIRDVIIRDVIIRDVIIRDVILVRQPARRVARRDLRPLGP
ncbi:MAG: hypothetical protein ACXV5S_02880 [Acidimicrobiales bacterium]